MLELPDMVKEEVMPRGARMGIRGGDFGCIWGVMLEVS